MSERYVASAAEGEEEEEEGRRKRGEELVGICLYVLGGGRA